MSKTAVINPTGDQEDNIVRWAKNLGTSKIRRKLFNEVYGRISRKRIKNNWQSMPRSRTTSRRRMSLSIYIGST